MLDGRGRLRGRGRDMVYDGVAPLVLLTLGLVDAVTGFFTEPVGRGPVAVTLVPGAIACVLLVMRRYRPLLTLVLVLLVLLLPTLVLPAVVSYWDGFMVWVVALYSCGRHASRRAAIVAAAVSVAAMALLVVEFPELRDPGGVVFNSALLAAGFAVGALARSWAGYRERLVRSAAERAVAEERASRRERERLARELHDVVSHTIAVIVMQAGGARMASAADPHVAVEALARIESLGRDSLAELRTLLDVLRDDAAEPPPAPQPTLAQVPLLCERMRELGLPVRLRSCGELRDLPAGVQLTGYRVVQEGLTNVLKHAGAVATDVRVERTGAGGLSVRIASASAPSPGSALPSSGRDLPGASRGLEGLHERVRAWGGTFSAGPDPDGGFVIAAEVPSTGAAT